MKRAPVVALFVLFLSALTFAQANNPVPLVNQPLRPSAVSPGGAGFTLTVTGSNFVSGATVNWNGSPRATTFISYSKLTAAIVAADVTHVGTALITVSNPSPGGGASNVVYLPVHPKFAAGAFARRDTVLASGGLPFNEPFVGDFNGDGKLDVANMVGSTIEVFVGNGDGTFQNPVFSNSSLQGAALVASGDFNGDGKLDLIAGDIYGSYFTYLGNGDGTLTEASTEWGGWPGGIVSADLNRDGMLDVINEGSQEGAAGTDAQLGNGAGVFTPKWNSSINNQSGGFCAVADFNHDGKLDIACPGGAAFGNGIEVAFGLGNGTFGTPAEYPTPGVGFTVLTGDVNGDGKLDLVTDGGWVLLGNGDGTFNTPSGPAFSGAQYPQLADINANGKLDVIGSAYDLGTLRGVNSTVVALGNGDGTFQTPIAQEISWGDAIVAWGDFNGDGKLDAVTFVQDLITEKPIMSVLLQTNLGVSQTVISYGTLKVGTSSTQGSLLTNIGNSAITLSSIAFTSPAPSYTLGNGCASSLPPGASCTLTLTFTPQKRGAISAKVRISYSGTVGNPQYIEMLGTGN